MFRLQKETKPKSESSPSPSLVVISRPPAHFTPQQVTIDLSKNSTIPSTLSNGSGNSVTIYNIDESPTSLNLSTESSGYVSNSTTSSLGNLSLNQSGVNGEDVESEKSSPLLDQKLSTPIQSTFSALPMPPSVSSGRRRTISSNSNSSTLRSPSTVRAGTREVHNKLEKNRRAHLKECFEALKKQLPITPDEKKTSNLSILGAAIRHIQFVKRKEREYEHEMERLAKEKISNQNRIIFLKRELTQRDIDFTKLLPEQTDVTAVKSERNETSNDGKNGVLYNTSSSLPNTARTSPVASLTNSTNLSSNLMGTSSMPGSPSRITMLSTGNQIMPLSLTSKSTNDENLSSKLSINPIKLPTTNIQTKPTLMPIATPGSGSQMPTALNLKAGEIPSSCQTMPLNLHAAVSSVTNIQPLNGLKNGLKGYNNSKESKTNKSSSPVITSMSMSSNCMTQPQVTSTTSNMKIDQHEPPKKLIKLINGSAILAPDNKMIQHSNQLTLQQVVGGGGLVVSPIQLVASQGFKVIGQPNGVTTIELSGPNINGHPNTTLQHHQQQRSHHLTHTQPGNLQKLLMNGNGVTSTSSGNISTISIPTIAQHGTNGSRLAPGGAELNLLPSNTTPNGAVYRNQGKLAIMKDTNNSSRVHMMQSTPTIVVTQSQGINIITSSAQLSGKMMQTNAPQYLSATSVKPMLLVNHNGSGSPTSVANDVGKSQN
ncbi:CLUMA_CG002184, isoform A [Clunio marinus]|uniref:Max-binding protein MNT n=1 Tax=Clunio marinus TaxID=568069 RepID=A0A1J1HK44_9DIPT|nr:CLUMA_CG002184, isoform A [Clunio marinus]